MSVRGVWLCGVWLRVAALPCAAVPPCLAAAHKHARRRRPPLPACLPAPPQEEATRRAEIEKQQIAGQIEAERQATEKYKAQLEKEVQVRSGWGWCAARACGRMQREAGGWRGPPVRRTHLAAAPLTRPPPAPCPAPLLLQREKALAEAEGRAVERRQNKDLYQE